MMSWMDGIAVPQIGHCSWPGGGVEVGVTDSSEEAWLDELAAVVSAGLEWMCEEPPSVWSDWNEPGLANDRI